MLKNSFYRILSATPATLRVQLTDSHPIFEGHFPGMPITPGAILVQMAEEMLSDKLHTPVELTAIEALKFIQKVLPGAVLTFHFEEKDERTVRIVIADDTIKYAQLTATYLCLDPDL